jgi:hypothetical protein
LEDHANFIDPQLLIVVLTKIVPREVLFTPTGLTLLFWINILAGISALLGWFTRTSIFIFALVNWIFVAHAYSYAETHHPEALFAIFLMLLAFSPSGKCLSIDALIRRRRLHLSNVNKPTVETGEMGMWPLKLIHVLLALTYFSTGLAKVAYGGLRWMNGYTLQAHIFKDAILRDLPIGVWVAQQHMLCVFLSVFTMFFELFFFISVLFPRTAPYFFISGIFFHIGLYVTGGHPFFAHMTFLLLLLVFLAPEWWQAWLYRGKLLVRQSQRVDNSSV